MTSLFFKLHVCGKHSDEATNMCIVSDLERKFSLEPELVLSSVDAIVINYISPVNTSLVIGPPAVIKKGTSLVSRCGYRYKERRDIRTNMVQGDV